MNSLNNYNISIVVISKNSFKGNKKYYIMINLRKYFIF